MLIDDFRNQVLTQIENADLPATVYRSGRRLLDLASQHDGYIEITPEVAMDLCGTHSPNTMRAHFNQLRAANIINYGHSDKHARVTVRFLAYPPPIVEVWPEKLIAGRSELIAGRSELIAGRSELIAGRSESHANGNGHQKHRALSDQNRALSDQNRALSDQFDPATYTHAGGRVVVVVDPDPSNEEEGITTTTTNPPNPTEQALSVALLAHVGLKPMAAAKRLAATHPFGRIRDCVAYWWPQRKCVGGRFEDAPLIVLHWLDHWDTAMIPPMPPEFRRTDLYRDHCRTPAERKVDAEAEAELALLDQLEPPPRPVIERADPPTPERALWKQLTTDYAQLHDAELTIEGGRWVITTVMADWARVQLTRRIERDLKRAGVVATVEFAMKDQVTPEAQVTP